MAAFRRLAALAAGLIAALGASQAFAAEPMAAAACASLSDAGLPPALSGWTQRADLAAAGTAAQASEASLPVGAGVNALLKRNGEVTFPVLPAKPGGSVSYGGLYLLPIAQAGDYQVSLGAGAWIEVVSGRTLVQSTRHGPGPACSTLKKTVVFPLKPGRHLLEITGNGEPNLPLMVTRVE